jgi:Fe-S-cluster containining protein
LNLLEAYYTSVCQEDIDLWKKEGREDILSWVVVMSSGGSPVYDVWVSPSTGEHVNRCPWLRKLPNEERYVCGIHDVKPKHCREYPT